MMLSCLGWVLLPGAPRRGAFPSPSIHVSQVSHHIMGCLSRSIEAIRVLHEDTGSPCPTICSAPMSGHKLAAKLPISTH